MKPLLIILKILIVGYLWGILFIDGIRVILLIKWHFDIILEEHWSLLADKWNSGAPISNSEVGFFLVVISSIPLFIAGWVGLSMLHWGKTLKRIALSPLYLYRRLRLKSKPTVVVKKKAINDEAKTIKKPSTPIKKAPVKRPMLPSETLMQSKLNNRPVNPQPIYSAPQTPASAKKKQEEPITHALFNFDEDDFDLDFDFEKKEPSKKEDSIPSALVVDEPKTEPRTIDAKPEKTKSTDTQNKPREKTPHNKKDNNSNNNNSKKRNEEDSLIKESHTPVIDVLNQKGYDIIPSSIIKNITVDCIAVSKDQMLVCVVDKEVGDWLADEEKFNDDEPLWFSESSHRISPVRQAEVVCDTLRTKLATSDLNYEIIPYVVIQAGNIINAEDMFEIWSELNINVTRINRGSPKEIRLFSKSIENCDEKSDSNSLEKLKKLIRSIA